MLELGAAELVQIILMITIFVVIWRSLLNAIRSRNKGDASVD